MEKNVYFYILILNANLEPVALDKIAHISIQKEKVLESWELEKTIKWAIFSLCKP
jgi:hypothetical protein